MKPTYLFIVIHCCILTVSAQGEFGYYNSSKCNISDSIIEIKFTCYNPHRIGFGNSCWKAENSFDYTEYMESEEKDSIIKVFHKIIVPHLGRRVSNRIGLFRLSTFNEGTPYHLDSSAIEKYKLEAKHCLKIHYHFEGYFMFEDSVWFPINILIDLKGNMMYSSSILNTLKSLPSFQLEDPSRLFKKAHNHPFMNGYPPEESFELHYSERLKLFYFQFKSENGDLIKKDAYSTLHKYRYIFSNAITGEFLWSTLAKHYYESNGCVITTYIMFPDNNLKGNY